ncbi:MAG: FAD binding domain-containing protein [Methyloligellaceae bacterium]
MKAPDFSYTRAKSLDEAITLLNATDVDSSLIAGGQSLMAMLNLRIASTDHLVDLNGLTELRGIEERGNNIRIGALTRHSEIEGSALIAAELPLVAEAIREVAHVAIRNRGTIGGSLALADPAAELPACMMAYEADIIVVGTQGEKSYPASDFFLGVFETALQPGEVIKEIILKKRGSATNHCAFAELARRKGDYAMAGIAISTTGSQQIESAKIVAFGVSDKPEYAPRAEQALVGSPLPISDEKASQVAEAAFSEIEFAGDVHASAQTKAHLTKTLVRRSLAKLSGKDS